MSERRLLLLLLSALDPPSFFVTATYWAGGVAARLSEAHIQYSMYFTATSVVVINVINQCN